ncbi:uncharacterized protein LOC130130877 [Lampris incognitus]|uniref:uncharacterized protein LOC130130877 n=1 Tax=Lampris incognitus TaxID=2546036 RepID=UPI0024B50AC3|nr:uncharacterized protein LOC130130877 [Lampris incognitus]
MVLHAGLSILLATLVLPRCDLRTDSPDAETDPNWTPGPVGFVRLGEFCLRIPQEPDWATYTPVSPSSTQQHGPLLAQHMFSNPGRVEEVKRRNCRCLRKKKKLPTETSPVIRTNIFFPGPKCNTTEIIETLENGRRVCVNASGLRTYFSLNYPLQRNGTTPPIPSTPPIPTIPPIPPIPTTPTHTIHPYHPTHTIHPTHTTHPYHPIPLT